MRKMNYKKKMKLSLEDKNRSYCKTRPSQNVRQARHAWYIMKHYLRPPPPETCTILTASVKFNWIDTNSLFLFLSLWNAEVYTNLFSNATSEFFLYKSYIQCRFSFVPTWRENKILFVFESILYTTLPHKV